MKEKIASKIKDLKKSLVLEEACKYFEEVGFENVKMSDLAKNCDISVGQLYKLFDSKENIFYEYVSYIINQFYENLISQSKELSSPKDKLLLYLRLKFAIFNDKKRTLTDPVAGDPLFFSKLNTKNRKIVQPIFEFLSIELEKLAREYGLEDDLNFLQVAYIFNSFTMGYVEYWLNSDDDKLNVDVEDILERFIAGFTCKGKK